MNYATDNCIDECNSDILHVFHFNDIQVVRSPGGTAIVAIEFARYVYSGMFPNQEENTDEGNSIAIKFIAALGIAIATTANCFTVRLASRVVFVFVMLKVGPILRMQNMAYNKTDYSTLI